ncbi:ROK family protein [Lactococcus allomyrinae]|uniref:ROK family protein n=1 Tax=Lactococcus allomyrinae TaxID=2419773 RepID=A0A387BIL4_9LACT|nr:ROK family protein [Lactococcus allomyrinae]AYG00877.1 ROK family protein [Lactococcus allomyrinae]
MSDFLAFDIGGTFVKYGVVADDGEILEKGKFPTPDEEKPFLSALTEMTKSLSVRFELAGIGISAPGTPNRDGVMVNFGGLTKMYGLPLREKLSALTDLPVVVENDANAAAIAEKWLGAGKDYSDYMVMALGTGIGGGIVINDQIYRGGHGIAGEFGWALTNGITVVGELEDVSQNFKAAAVMGLLRTYNEAQKSITHGHFTPLLEAKEVVDLAQAGDKIAGIVFEQFLCDLTVNLMNLTACFDPEVILIGGGISANDYFIRALQAKWSELIERHFGLSRIKNQGLLTEIKPAGLQNDAGMLGAAYTIKMKLRP